MKDKWSGKNKTIARNKCVNDIASRIDSKGIDREDAVGIVLADSSGRDTKALVKSGFSKDNIINVNNDLDIIIALRDKEYKAIYGDFGKVILSLSYKIDFIIGDLSGGISKESLKLMDIILNLNFDNIVVYMNLSGVRDRPDNIRKLYHDPEYEIIHKIRKRIKSDVEDKDRAKMMVSYALSKLHNLQKISNKSKTKIFKDIEFYKYISDTARAWCPKRKKFIKFNHPMYSFVTTICNVK